MIESRLIYFNRTVSTLLNYTTKKLVFDHVYYILTSVVHIMEHM